MKKARLFCALAAGAVLLSACGQTEETDTEGTAEPAGAEADGQENISFDLENQYVGVSEDGYYFWEAGATGRLMFLDRESGKTVSLCNKPNCTHEGQDCNAYFPEFLTDWESGELTENGFDYSCLQYCEGSLYAIGLDTEYYAVLYRIGADGSGDWETCTRLYKTDYGSTRDWKAPTVLFVDGGRVYYVDRAQESQQLVSVKLDGKDETVIFQPEEGMTAEVYRMKKYGDCLYYQAMTYAGEDWETYAGGLYRYDPATGENGPVKDMLITSYGVRDGMVYYGDESGLCRYSTEDEATEVLADTPMDVPYVCLTDEYIAVSDYDDSGRLTLYGYDGVKIADVEPCDEMFRVIGGDSDILFADTRDAQGYSAWAVLDLGNDTGDLQWKLVGRDTDGSKEDHR